MSSDPLARVTQMLRDEIAEPAGVEALPPGRDEAVAKLADALRARARTRRRSRALTMLAVAAGIALLLGGGAWAARRSRATDASVSDLGRVLDPTGSVTALRDGRSEAAVAGSRMADGTELRTAASSEAHLDFASGTRLTVGGSARVRLVEQSQRKRFALEAGSLAAKVAKLGPDERFVVTTSDAEVEVRGTAFRVTVVEPDLACAGGSPTRVDVSEGVVVVRHAGVEQRVAAGEQWPVCERRAVPTTPAASATTAAAPPPAAHGTAVAAHGAVAAAPEASSHLAEQNDLFDEAMRLKRNGETDAALAKLDRLRASYPGGPLAESASAERMRLLASTDPKRAAVAAREYLRRHPRGFARAEAEALAGGSR